MARTRDYKAEYERRIANAAKRGLSRSQARGHARSDEESIRSKSIRSDDRLEAALKLLRRTGHQRGAAKQAGIAPERFRRFLRENALARREGQEWQITDDRPRRMTVLTEGESKELTLAGYEEASINGEHLAAVRAFLGSNDIELLLPFAGRSVIDAKGQSHPLETDPNRLHRIAAQGSEIFHEVYSLVQ